MHDPIIILPREKMKNMYNFHTFNTELIAQLMILTFPFGEFGYISHTFEYIKHSGKLIAIDKIQTNIILTVTRFRVLFRPNRIGYRSDK